MPAVVVAAAAAVVVAVVAVVAVVVGPDCYCAASLVAWPTPGSVAGQSGERNDGKTGNCG